MLSHLAECCGSPARLMTIEETTMGGRCPWGGRCPQGEQVSTGEQVSIMGQVSAGRTGVRGRQVSVDKVQGRLPWGEVRVCVCGSGTQNRDLLRKGTDGPG